MGADIDAIKAKFHAFSYRLGPFGRQDVHLHPRIDRKAPADVLVGFRRDCDPKGLHVQMRLEVGSVWSKRGQEGEPLAGSVGKTPRKREVVVAVMERVQETEGAGTTTDGDER